MFKHIDHLALHVADVEAAVAFYVDTFGFQRFAEHSGAGGHAIAYVKLGDTILELTTRPGGEAMSGFHFCLLPDDFDAAFERLRERNLPVVSEPRPTAPRRPDEEGWRRAVFRGPHGELIEIRG